MNIIEIAGEKVSLNDEEYKVVRNVVDSCKSKNDPFARDPDSVFYIINQLGEVDYIVDYFGSNDAEKYYACANYCNEKKLMIKRAYYEKLERLLWRYSMQHGGPGNYSITYDMSSKDFNIVDMSAADWKVFGPTFSTYEEAENACAKIIRPMLEADKKSFENILF